LQREFDLPAFVALIQYIVELSKRVANEHSASVRPLIIRPFDHTIVIAVLIESPFLSGPSGERFRCGHAA
jgi:hypothetical protein